MHPRRLTIDRREKFREPPFTASADSRPRRLASPPELRPLTDHRRQLFSEVLRQHDMQPHEAEIGDKQLDVVFGNCGVLLTCARRAKPLEPN